MASWVGCIFPGRGAVGFSVPLGLLCGRWAFLTSGSSPALAALVREGKGRRSGRGLADSLAEQDDVQDAAAEG